MDAAGAGVGTTAADAGGAGQLDADRRGAAGLDTLRALLEAECAAAEAVRGSGGNAGPTPPTLHTPGPFPWRGSGSGKGGGGGGAFAPFSSSLCPPDLPPQVDAGPPTALAAGRARVPRTADAVAGALNAADFLAPGRHGEWVEGSGGVSARPPATPACGAWGVSEFPPGVDVSDPAVAAAVRRQQAR